MGTTANDVRMRMSADFSRGTSAAGSFGTARTGMWPNNRGSSKTKKKKQLNYNTKEISSQLLRASKTRNASLVLTRAKGKVTNLQQCLATGQYNENEVRAAIAHANRMVKCAQLKVKNLKEEEQLKKKNENTHASSEQQKKNKIKQKVRQKEQALKTKAAIEQNQHILQEKTRRQELLRKRRQHRNQEQGKINEADIKYMQERLNHQNDSGQNDSGVMMELSMRAVELSGLQLSEHAMQLLEQQMEQEAELEMESVMGSDMGFAGMSTAAVSGTGSSAGAGSGECASIDVVV